MSTSLEEMVRDVLFERAGDIPPLSVERTTLRPYRPRLVSNRTRALVLAAITVIGAVTASVVLSTSGPTRQDAFATWSATPTRGSAAQVTGAERACVAAVVRRVDALPNTQQAALFIGDADRWHPVITDTRGPFTLVALAATTATLRNDATCLIGGPFTSASPDVEVGAGGFGGSSSVAPSAITAPAAGEAKNLEAAIGRVGSAVAGVTLVLQNGTRVTASIGRGYYAAWWPGPWIALSAEVSAATGSRSQSFSANSASEILRAARCNPGAEMARSGEPAVTSSLRQVASGEIGGTPWTLWAQNNLPETLNVEEGALVVGGRSYGLCDEPFGEGAVQVIDAAPDGLVYGYAVGSTSWKISLSTSSGSQSMSRLPQATTAPVDQGTFFIEQLPESACRLFSLHLEATSGLGTATRDITFGFGNSSCKPSQLRSQLSHSGIGFI